MRDARQDVLTERDGQGIAGVGIVGEDPNWTGNYLLQSNLYGFGRLCWNPDLSTEEITDEWVRQTFGHDEAVVDAVSEILLDSWQACIDYHTGGIGLMHMMYNGEKPSRTTTTRPWEWPEYHGATADGIGVDRTTDGSGYAAQYREPLTDFYDDPRPVPSCCCFPSSPWEYELEDGTTVIQRLYDDLYAGAAAVDELRERWLALEGRSTSGVTVTSPNASTNTRSRRNAGGIRSVSTSTRNRRFPTNTVGFRRGNGKSFWRTSRLRATGGDRGGSVESKSVVVSYGLLSPYTAGDGERVPVWRC